MIRILAVDPGYERSAWVWLESGRVLRSGVLPNEAMLEICRSSHPDVLVLEQVEGYGMAVGREVFETVYWTGRFAQAAFAGLVRVERIGRKAVKLHLCGTARAKDPNVRQALIDRFGASKAEAVGTKKAPGPLHGVSGDMWSALAVAVTYEDGIRGA